MNLRHTVACNELEGRIVEIVPLDPGAEQLLVSVEDGTLCVFDVAAARVARTVRRGEGWAALAPTRVLAIFDGCVALWGHESVVGIDLSTGASRWTIADGDHSLDGDEGHDAAVTGTPYAVLPNGAVVDLRSGTYVHDAGDSFADATAMLDRPEGGVLVARSDGALLRWDAAPPSEPPRTVARLPARAVALAFATPAAGIVLAACGDTTVVSASDEGGAVSVISPSCAADDELAEVCGLSGSPDGVHAAVLLGIYSRTTYARRWEAFVVDLTSGVRTDLTFPRSSYRGAAVAPVWTSPDRVILAHGDQLFEYLRAERFAPGRTVALPAAATALLAHSDRLIVGDADGRLHVFQAHGGHGTPGP
jgi:hypothetical protein